MIPKPNHKRRVPIQSKRNNFSKKVRKEIHKRDDGICQICYSMKGTEIHHCKFKSQGGRGVATNGILLCSYCHRQVHQDYELAESIRKRMETRFGKDYHKDEWD